MAAPDSFFYIFKHDSKVFVVPAEAAVLKICPLDKCCRVALCADENQVIEGIRKVETRPAREMEAAARRMAVEINQEHASAAGKPKAADPAAGGAA